MKEISLTLGKTTLVDDEDFIFLDLFKWYAHNEHGTFYATTQGCKIRMHRLILDCYSDKEVDHIDGNGLNNQKSNLRIVTHRQNLQNQKNRKIKKSSRYPGVHRMNGNRKKPWRATMHIGNTYIHIGCYQTEFEAFAAYKNEIYMRCSV